MFRMTTGGTPKSHFYHSDFPDSFALRHFLVTSVLQDELVHVRFHSKR
jgi:hypothetical protein